ncbi:MAG TPA: MATE family efflux transporter [Tepidisphaeraceae bacterium]|nr:MATE family efflux transporter [Tepidisphaeraceae bacterium]
MTAPAATLPLQPDKVRTPLAELLFLAAPTVAQMASYTVMQFCDALQLSVGAGDVAATAAGMAGFMAFTGMAWAFGALMVVNTLVSQSLGAGNREACGRHLWQGIWLAVLIGLLLVPTRFVSAPLFALFGHSPELVAQEKAYYDVQVLATPVRLATLATGQFLLAIGRPNITLLAAAVSAVVNIGLNHLLINGHLGFPRMGVAGAAWATNAAVCVEFGILALFAWSRAIRAQFHSGNWRLNVPAMRLLVRLGIPAGIQTVSEVFAWFLFSVWIMNAFGQAAVAANNYMFQYMKVSFMPAFGISAAVTALVGRYLGAGRLDLARQRAHLGFKVTLVYMLVCGTVFFLGRYALIGVFSDNAEVIRIGATLLVFASIFQLFDGLYVIYIGALRGAGDTTVPAWVTAGLCWTITVGGGYLAARHMPWLGVSGPWVMASLYGVILGTYLSLRFARGDWKAIDQGHPTPAPSNALPASTTIAAST